MYANGFLNGELPKESFVLAFLFSHRILLADPITLHKLDTATMSWHCFDAIHVRFCQMRTQ